VHPSHSVGPTTTAAPLSLEAVFRLTLLQASAFGMFGRFRIRLTYHIWHKLSS
jgi:hypothetical protein